MKALIRTGQDNGMQLGVLQAVEDENERQDERKRQRQHQPDDDIRWSVKVQVAKRHVRGAGPAATPWNPASADTPNLSLGVGRRHGPESTSSAASPKLQRCSRLWARGVSHNMWPARVGLSRVCTMADSVPFALDLPGAQADQSAWEKAAADVLRKTGRMSAEDPEAKRRELVDDYQAKFNNPYVAAARGLIDDVIDPAETRRVRAALG